MTWFREQAATEAQLRERIAELERQVEEQFLRHAEVTLNEVRRARAEERERCRALDLGVFELPEFAEDSKEAAWLEGYSYAVNRYRNAI